MAPNPVAVIDADVLYSIEITDVLLTMAARRVIRVHWSTEILNEVRRNLIKRPALSEEAVDYRVTRMNAALPDALADAPADLVASMPINPKDRHVLALAVHLEADFLVTNNLRDFPNEACARYGVEPVGPDEFLTRAATVDLATARAVIDEIADRRTNPPQSASELVDRLRGRLPDFTALVQP